MQKPIFVKWAARDLNVHSNDIYGAIHDGKLQVVPGIKPYQILADSYARYKRIRQAKRALALEERELTQDARE